METTDNIAPLYAQVKQRLMEQIANGGLNAGDFLPTEPELCEEMGVSRITLRRAVKELCDEGLLIRQQGRGTVVARKKVRQTLVSLSGFSEAFESEGDVVHEVLAAEENTSDPAAAAVLGDGPLMRAERLISVDGKPFTLEALFLNTATLPYAIEPVRTGRSFFQALRENDGPVPAAADRTINVTFASPTERRHLRIGPTQPVYRIEKTVRDENGGAIAFSRLVTPTHLITFSLSS